MLRGEKCCVIIGLSEDFTTFPHLPVVPVTSSTKMHQVLYLPDLDPRNHIHTVQWGVAELSVGSSLESCL